MSLRDLRMYSTELGKWITGGGEKQKISGSRAEITDMQRKYQKRSMEIADHIKRRILGK